MPISVQSQSHSHHLPINPTTGVQPSGTFHLPLSNTHTQQHQSHPTPNSNGMASSSSYAPWSGSAIASGSGSNNIPSTSFSAGVIGSSSFSFSSAPGGAATTPTAATAPPKDLLKSLQDVSWSDDGEPDPECPLCMEELDPSDVNFKPCVCGYQICRFCHHQIIHDLNGLCPACRRRYDEQEIKFVAVDPEDMKRLQTAKALKSKINKQLETLNRRHLRDVRIVLKNMVYVLGMRFPSTGPGSGNNAVGSGIGRGGKARGANVNGDGEHSNEEFLALLRSGEYFGQYGKIGKVWLRKLPSTELNANSSGYGRDRDMEPTTEDRDKEIAIYITYVRREDASRAIQALDGYPSPNNPGKSLKASYGTTKYCLSWLRGVKCDEGQSCFGLHDWAGEGDTFTRQDMTTLQHTIKETATAMDMQAERQRLLSSSSRQAPSVAQSITTPSAPPGMVRTLSSSQNVLSKSTSLKQSEEDASALPKGASWATKPAAAPLSMANLAALPPARRKAKVLSLSSMSKTGPVPAITTATTPAVKEKPKTIYATPSPTILAASRMKSSSSISKVDKDKDKDTEKQKSSMTVLSRSSTLSEKTAPVPNPVSAPPGLESRSVTPSVESSSQAPSPMPSPPVQHSAPAPPPISPETAEPEQASAKPTSTPTAPQEANDLDSTPSLPALMSSSQEGAESMSPLPSPVPLSPSDRDMNIGYQPSVQAQALVDEVLTRREGGRPVYAIQSPYPDFDDVFQCFADGDFEYRLDVKMEVEVEAGWDILAMLLGGQAAAEIPKLEPEEPVETPYEGAFDPFTEHGLDELGGLKGSGEEDAKRKSSRFGFANRSGDEPMDPRQPLMAALLGNNVARQFSSPGPASPALQNDQTPASGTGQSGYFPPVVQGARRQDMTPSSTSAMPYPLAASPAPRERTNTSGGSASAPSVHHQQQQQQSAPPPPPGFIPGNPAYPPYQQSTNASASGRGAPPQSLDQQYMAGIHSYQQLQHDGRRAHSPTVAQGLRGGVNRYSREAYGQQQQQSADYGFQDPAIMSMRMMAAGGGSPYPQQQLNYFDGKAMAPYPSSAFPQQQQMMGGNGGLGQQNMGGDGMAPNARFMQQMHEQQRAGSPGNGNPRASARQAFYSGKVY